MRRVRHWLAGSGAWVAGIGVALASGLLLDRERSIGGIVWALITMFGMYHLGLWLAGPHLLPIEPDRESISAARRVLRRFAGGHKTLMAVVREGKVLPGPHNESRDHADGEGAIFVDSTSAVALFTDTGLSRVKGPGVHFTRGKERLGIVVDLRPQARSEEVKTQTRDGIWVKFKVNTKFQIAGVQARKVQTDDRNVMPWPAVYAWSPYLITRALILERAGSDNTLVGWDDIVLDKAVKHVHTLIAGYTFDELTEPRNPLIDRREEIQKILETEVKAELVELGLTGIRVMEVKLTQFVPCDNDVNCQRLESWQTEWDRRKKVIEAEGEAESRRKLALARAQAQMDAMARLIEALDASRRAGTNNADLIALRFLEVVESLAQNLEMQKTLGDIHPK